MANVIAVAESSDTSSIKVMFSNLSAGVRLDLGKFDNLANDFSKQFNGLHCFQSSVCWIQESNQTVDERPSLSLFSSGFRRWFLKGIARGSQDRKIVLTSHVLTPANGNLAWRSMKSPEIRKEMKQMGRVSSKSRKNVFYPGISSQGKSQTPEEMCCRGFRRGKFNEYKAKLGAGCA
ncbi:uncharacterized protein [Montipora capricornis]|uniref:uncharacterized protein n=1 Tax=Montipora capricornis TaxID=246305 RepID=UPI0035F14286